MRTTAIVCVFVLALVATGYGASLLPHPLQHRNCRITTCFVNPCMVTSCPRHPNAECIEDYCGGCKARYFINMIREVTHQCGVHPRSRHN